MTKKRALKIALELLNNGSHQSYELTQMEAIKRGDEIVCKTKDATTASFFHIEHVTKVATALNLECIARIEDDKVVIILF